MTNPTSVERVVYQNGRMTRDIPSFVQQHMANAAYGEIVMTTMIRRPTADLEEQLLTLQKPYLGRVPIENGCYPNVTRQGRSLVGHLHFEPAYVTDGEVFDGLVKEVAKLSSESLGNRNKQVTITMRIRYYKKEKI